MMLHVYCTRNKKSGQYGKIALESLDKDAIKESYTCSCLEAPEDQKILLSELEAYYLGEYDTKTGHIKSVEPEFLMDLGSVCGKESSSD